MKPNCLASLFLAIAALCRESNAVTVGKFKEVYRWKQVDFDFPSAADREARLANGSFIPINNILMGIEPYVDRIFLTLPRWKDGVAASLVTVPRIPEGDASPLLQPYPDWSWHPNPPPRTGYNASCEGFTSVFRIQTDECGRLWVIDSGTVHDIEVVCPPKIVVFDLATDKLLRIYEIPADQRKSGSFFVNLLVDIRHNQCDDAFVYATDVYEYGLLVYSWKTDSSYRIENEHFRPDDEARDLVLDNISMQWTDGLIALALSPYDAQGDRLLFFHALLSFKECAVRTSLLRNEAEAKQAKPEEFRVLGTRGKRQSTCSAIDNRGVLFFSLVTQDAVGCWDSAKPYNEANVGTVGRDHQTLNYANAIKVDREEKQNLWVMSDRMPRFFHSGLNPNEFNVRILTTPVDLATEGTVCHPSGRSDHSTTPSGTPDTNPATTPRNHRSNSAQAITANSIYVVCPLLLVWNLVYRQVHISL